MNLKVAYINFKLIDLAKSKGDRMFTKRFEYAFILLRALKGTKEEKPLLGRNLIKDLGIPQSMAAGILTELSNAGIISGKKGKEGGYFRVKDEISLYDLFILLEGNTIKIIYSDDKYREIMFRISSKILNELQCIKI